MICINHATPSGLGGFACLFAATFMSPLRGCRHLGYARTISAILRNAVIEWVFNSTTRSINFHAANIVM
jgi:hypothetical protein